MVSSFQFSNPSLLKLSFALNNGFETEDASQINISLESHVETQPGPEENSAVVVLNLLIGKKDDLLRLKKLHCFGGIQRRLMQNIVRNY